MARKTIGNAMAKTRNPVTIEQKLNAGDAKAVKHMAGDSIQNLVAGMNTDRDKRTFNFYGVPRVLTRFELENMYRASWIAKRIINGYADDMTKEWRRFTLGDDDSNPNLTILENEERKLRIKHRFNEALRWSRLYGGCLIILGIRGDRDLSKPLNVQKLGKGCLQWIRVLDRWRVSPSGALDLDLESDHYALPQSYIVAESAIEVHASRVIRLNGEQLPYFAWLQNARWDDSVLQHVFDSLSNNDTISSAVATMMFEANVDVISSEGLADKLAIQGGAEKIRERYTLAQLMKSFNRTMLLDGTEKYEKKSNSFTNIADIWNEAKLDVCGASEYAYARLFGQSPGGLSSTGDGDLENYYGNVGSKQEQELRPKMEQFDEVFVRHCLGSMPDDYKFSFNELWVMSDKDQAQLTLNKAQRDHIYIQDGVATPGLIASELKQSKTYASMSDEDVKMAEELGQPMNPDQSLEEEVNKQTTTGEAQLELDKKRANELPTDGQASPRGRATGRRNNGKAGAV